MAQGVKGTGPTSKETASPQALASQARGHCKSAIKVLEGICNNTTIAPAARIAAANSLLDRGLGKPAQQVNIEGKLDGMLTIVTGVPERLNGGELIMEAIEDSTEPTDSAAGHSRPEQHKAAMEPATHTHTASHSLTLCTAHTSPRPTPGAP